jgi:hypothetical protein
MLIHDYDVRIIDAATGALIRHLTTTPRRTINPEESPAAAHDKSSEPPTRVQGYSDDLQHHTEQ